MMTSFYCYDQDPSEFCFDAIVQMAYYDFVSYRQEYNNYNNNKLYLYGYNKVLQYCESYLNLIIDSFLN